MKSTLWQLVVLLILVCGQAATAAPPVASFRSTGARPGDASLASRELDSDDLKDLSLVDLKLLRDGIYARHGHKPFRVPWVQTYFEAQAWYRPRGIVSQKDLNPVERANATLIWNLENNLSPTTLQYMREKVLKGRDASKLTYTERLEVDLSYELQTRQQARTSTHDKLWTLAELRKLERGTLSVLRNGIYAHRGRPFKDETIRRYFQRQGDYAENPRYTDALLSATDRLNLERIMKVENERGGPLMDIEAVYVGGGR